MSTGAANFVDRIDPFAKRSLKKKTKRSQGSSRYRASNDVELHPLPLLKGTLFVFSSQCFIFKGISSYSILSLKRLWLVFYNIYISIDKLLNIDCVYYY